jgi:hypothetical protein
MEPIVVHFAEVVVPALSATDLALATDIRTGLDTAYAIKSALHEAYGDGTVRPWRLVGAKNGLLRVVGCVPSADALPVSSTSRRLGLSSHVVPVTLSPGARMQIEVEVTPVKNVRHRDPETRRIVGDHRLDITAVRAEAGSPTRYVQASGADLELAYMKWLTEQFSSDERGTRVLSLPDILDSTPAFRTRKLREMTAQVGISRVRARFDVEIRDPKAFAGLLRHGMKRMKDVGLGSIIPSAVLSELAL